MRSMMLGGKEHGGGRGLAINRSVSRDRLDVEASTVPSSWRSFLHNKLRKICPHAQCVRLRSLVVQYLRSPNQCLSCFFAGAKQNQASTKKGPSTNQAELVWGLRASPAAERVALSAWADALFFSQTLSPAARFAHLGCALLGRLADRWGASAETSKNLSSLKGRIFELHMTRTRRLVKDAPEKHVLKSTSLKR